MSERHSDIRVVRWTDRIQDILHGQMRGPIRAQLDLTNLCSHACPWCEPVDFRKQTITDKRHTLDAAVALEVLADLKLLDCRMIYFSGGGEPTLHPAFDRILGAAKYMHDFRTLVVTHGGYIDRWIDVLLLTADHVRVSLDASSPEEHQQNHGAKVGEFEKVVSNLRELVVARRGRPKPEIGVTYTITDCNKSPESFERLYKLAEDIGVDFVQIRPVSEDMPAVFLPEPWADVRQRIPQPPLDLDVRILGQRGNDVFLQRDFDRCYATLTAAFISANGEVCACCDRRDLVYGNVNQESFRDIWLSNRHREKARQIVPKLCQRCVLCGYNRAVQRYVVNNEAVCEYF